MTANVNDSPSVTVPVSLALDRVTTVLFRPFDLGRWLIIGFCAWLATLASGGGGSGGGGQWDLGRRRPGAEVGEAVRDGLRHAKEFALENLHWLVPLAVTLLVIGILIWLLVLWLSSRGQFMFLHCVATNRAEVVVPWRQYEAQGNSLFWFRLGLGLLGFVCLVPLIVGAAGMVLTMVLRGEPDESLIIGSVLLVLLAVGLAIGLAVVSKLTIDFVVPVMAVRRSRCRAAWGEVLGLFADHKLDLLLYLLFQIVLAIVIGILVLAVVVMTCCCAGCLLILPYIGTVVYLPVLVFRRAYSLIYLAQFGPEYQVIPADPAPSPGAAG